MKTVIVDFTNAKEFDDLHEILMEKLEFPDFYGMNIPALWDCLTGFIELPISVVLKGLNSSSRDLENEKSLIKKFFCALKSRIGEYM